MAADAAQPAGRQADARRRAVALLPADARQLQRRGLRSQQEPHGAAGRIQPRLPARAARRDRHPLRRAYPGHAAAVPHPEATRRCGQGHRGAQVLRRAFRGARPQGLRRGRAGARRDTAQVRRRAAPAWRRNRRLLQVHAIAREDGRSLRRALPLRRCDRGARAGRQPHHRRAHRRGAADRRPVRGRARQLLDRAARALKHPHPGLPGQGFLDHRADHRCVLRARVDDHGRDAQGRRHPPRRPHPRRRHGAAVGLRPEPDRRAPAHAGARGHRPVPARR